MLLALAGNTIIPVGLSVQKWAHTEYSSTHYLKVPYWWYEPCVTDNLHMFAAYA